MRTNSFNDVDFENLFNTIVNIVMSRGDYGDKKLFSSICDIYDIKDYAPEIQHVQKKYNLQIMEFTYIEGYVVDVRSTLRSMYNFFNIFVKFEEFKEEYKNLLDTIIISTTIIPALEIVINYIEGK